MASDEVVIVEHHGAVATVRVNRPEAHNALNARVLAELDAALALLVATGDVRAVVITGTGTRSFSAGADLEELTGLTAERAFDVLSAGQRVFRRLECLPIPTVAAVNGLALGGGFELALACSFTVFAEHASAGLPEAGLGLIPGFGGTQRLPRRIGHPAAAHLMLTGQRITAARAYALGLTPVEPVAAELVVAAAREHAERIAARGRRAVTAIMLALRHGADMPIDAGLALESSLAGLVTGGSEAAEGVAAFLRSRAARAST